MGNDMFNDEQLKHAEILQKETEDALGFWKERALKAEAERDNLLSRPAPPADAATEAVRMLRHLCNVYGCTSYGRTPDHGPDDCSWCEAEALLALSPAPAPSAPAMRRCEQP